MNPFPELMPGAEPLFARGNQVSCLVLHGFMASPGEVKWLSEHLHEQGYTVYTPRLYAHGSQPDDMKRMRWRDLYLHAVDGYHILRQQCDQIFVVGHSMGGLLALLIAATLPVTGVVAAAVPLTITDRRVQFSKWLQYPLPHTIHPPGQPLTSRIYNEQKRRGEPMLGRVRYQQWATRALYELYELSQTTKNMLGYITEPLLALYAENDDTVSLGDMLMITKQIKSSVCQEHILEQGGHIIFQDVGRNEAFWIVSQFISQQLAVDQDEE